MSVHLKNFEVQYLNNQASDHSGSHMFAHTLLGYSICFQNCVTSNMIKFEPQ